MSTLLSYQSEIEWKLEQIRVASDAAMAYRFKYYAYLESSEWHSLRNRVIIRCKGICEVCGLAKVVDIHHLTYERVFKELLEDLLGTCRDCHDDLHGVKDDFMIPLVFGGV